MSNIYEQLNSQVRMLTAVQNTQVVYTVEMFEDNEWCEQWRRIVCFGRDRCHRPGGKAFQLVAHEQEKEAFRLSQELGGA